MKLTLLLHKYCKEYRSYNITRHLGVMNKRSTCGNLISYLATECGHKMRESEENSKNVVLASYSIYCKTGGVGI